MPGASGDYHQYAGSGAEAGGDYDQYNQPGAGGDFSKCKSCWAECDFSTGAGGNYQAHTGYYSKCCHALFNIKSDLKF